MGMVDEFKKFIARGNVVDLAVGVIIGAAFGAITKSMVDDVFSPLLALVTGGLDFSKKGIILRDAELYANAAEAAAEGVPVILYGNLINAFVNFFLVALVMFAIVKVINGIKERREKEELDPESPAEPPAEVKLLREIRDLLKEGPAPAREPKADATD